MHQSDREWPKELFKNCPFTIDSLMNLNDHASRLWVKFRHIENVAFLMGTSAEVAGFSEKEKLMAFTAGQFHDIALTGKEYSPQHGARGAIITFGLLSKAATYSLQKKSRRSRRQSLTMTVRSQKNSRISRKL